MLMRLFRRDQPQPERRIVYTVIFQDPLATERYRMTQRLLNGEEIDPNYPGWEAFRDPYWTGEGYKPPEESTPNQSSEYGHKSNYGSLPRDPFQEPGDPFGAFDVPLYRLLGLDRDPLEAAQAEMDSWMAEADAMYHEAEEMYRMAEAEMSASIIPPHAKILYYGIFGKNYRNPVITGILRDVL